MSLKGRVSPELDAAWAEWAEGLTAYEIDHFQNEAIPVGIVWAENEIRRLRGENERLKKELDDYENPPKRVRAEVHLSDDPEFCK